MNIRAIIREELERLFTEHEIMFTEQEGEESIEGLGDSAVELQKSLEAELKFNQLELNKKKKIRDASIGNAEERKFYDSQVKTIEKGIINKKKELEQAKELSKKAEAAAAEQKQSQIQQVTQSQTSSATGMGGI